MRVVFFPDRACLACHIDLGQVVCASLSLLLTRCRVFCFSLSRLSVLGLFVIGCELSLSRLKKFRSSGSCVNILFPGWPCSDRFVNFLCAGWPCERPPDLFTPLPGAKHHPASHGRHHRPAPTLAPGEGLRYDGWLLPGPRRGTGERTGEGKASVTQLPGCRQNRQRRGCSHRQLATGQGGGWRLQLPFFLFTTARYSVALGLHLKKYIYNHVGSETSFAHACSCLCRHFIWLLQWCNFFWLPVPYTMLVRLRYL